MIENTLFYIVLASEEAVKNFNLKPLARIISYADGETEPIDFCIAPVKSSQRALDYIDKKITDIDYFEINEAFSVTVLANMKVNKMIYYPYKVN